MIRHSVSVVLASSVATILDATKMLPSQITSCMNTSFAVGIFAEAPPVHARGLRGLQHSADELLRRQLCLSRPRRHRQQRRQQDHLQHELRRRQRKLRQEVLLPWIHISERGQDTEVSEISVLFERFKGPSALGFWTPSP